MPIIQTCPSCGKPNRIPARHLADTGKCGACKTPLPPIADPLAVAPDEIDEILRDSKVPVLEQFPQLAARYNVQGIPNFAVFSNGNLQFQQAGLVDANTMKSWLARAA